MRNIPTLIGSVALIGMSYPAATADHRTQGKSTATSRSETGPNQQLGREQSNTWVPVDMVTASTPAERREMMLSYIREQVADRRSTIDTAELERVVGAMGKIDRDQFVPAENRRSAYLPVSVDIGFGQTLSDAYIVAVTATAARIHPGDRVLDVGTGSGYQAALLNGLGAAVTSIEIIPELADQASRRLKAIGYDEVRVITGDGSAGVPSAAPFDVIVVAAGGATIPDALTSQLASGGRLIIPVGPTQKTEQLLVITKEPTGRLSTCSLGRAAFVPLTGRSQPSTQRKHEEAVADCFGAPVT